MKRTRTSVFAGVVVVAALLTTAPESRAATPTGTTSQVSVSAPGVLPNNTVTASAISADGRFVGFSTAASNLVAGDTCCWDVFVRDVQAGTTEKISRSPTGAQTNNDSHSPALSADGRYVAFYSLASNLVPGDTNGTWDVFVFDRNTQTTERVSVASDEAQGNASSDQSGSPGISSDGRYVTFRSSASNLVTGDTCCWDIFVRDRVAGTTTRASIPTGGGQGNADSHSPGMSGDGRFVAFYSLANNLILGDTNATWDIFVRDLVAETTERVSVDSAGLQANNTSDQFGPPSLSTDGRYVAYRSLASNLHAGDTNGTWDTFVRDRQAGTTVRASLDSAGLTANNQSHSPAISGAGRFVTFYSLASNLVAADTNGTWDIFVRDIQLATTTRVSVDSAGAQANNTSDQDTRSAISGDGRYVAYRSAASNLVPGDVDGQWDVFVRDTVTNTTSMASVSAANVGGLGDSACARPAASADGRFVAWSSNAPNLVPGDNNGACDIFVRDRVLGTTELASRGPAGVLSNGDSRAPVLSADGRFVAFGSSASNLVAGDTNATWDIFVRDRLLGTTERVSVDSIGTQANSTSMDGALTSGVNANPAISPDGRYVAFHSAASNLVAGDTCCWDIFVRDRVTGTTSRASAPAGGGQSNSTSVEPSITPDGRYVAFASAASNLVPGDTCCWDIFVKDMQAGTIARVSTDANGVQQNNDAHRPTISADGRYVGFQSFASNLVPLDFNGAWDIFVKDTQTGAIERASLDSSENEGNSTSHLSAVFSSDMRYVAYSSAASNLVLGDSCCYDVFVRDRTAGTTQRVSVPTGGGQGNNDSDYPVMSANGCTVVFRSLASNLVAGDINGNWDVFAHDCATILVSYTGATSAYFGESIGLGATLTDGAGTPIAGETVTFDILSGSTVLRSVQATTNSAGNAQASAPGDVGAGAYTVRATYSGNALAGSATDSEALQILARPTALAYTGPSSGIRGENATLSATLTDTRSGSPLGGKHVDFELAGFLIAADTDSSGVAAIGVHLSDPPGEYTVSASFPGEQNLAPAVASEAFTISKRPTALAYTGPASGVIGQDVTLAATLTDTTAQVPIEGSTVSFTLGPVTADAVTDASGVASATVTLALDAGSYTLEVSYGGEGAYEEASASAPFTVSLVPTTLSYTGATSGRPGRTVTLSAALARQGGDSVAGETVSFSLGSFSGSAVTGEDGVASIEAPIEQAPGAYDVVASFAGNAVLASSEATVPFEIAWPYTFTGETGLGTVNIYLDPEAKEFQFSAPGDQSSIKYNPAMQVVAGRVAVIPFADAELQLVGSFDLESGHFAAVARTSQAVYIVRSVL